jgi:hypothetical protein
LELIIEAEIFSHTKVLPLIEETKELNAILTTIVKKVKDRRDKR